MFDLQALLIFFSPPHCVCCTPGSIHCFVPDYQYCSPASQCLSLCLLILGLFPHTASWDFCLGWSPYRKKCSKFVNWENIYILEFCLPLLILLQLVKADSCYLQPVIETVWAFLCVHTLNVKFVREVKRDSEAGFHRNYILTGQSIWRGVRITWTHQVSF